MFVVASKWESLPGRFDEFEVAGRKMMALIRSWPEIEFFHNVRVGPESVLAIIGYRSQADYDRLINDPNGPFARAAAETNIDAVSNWLWSERGETLD